MTMISQSSFVSVSSKQTLGQFNNDLYRIQSDVFNKVVNLKNQKIKLLGFLSDSLDKRYQAQANLLHQIQIKKIKQQNLATKQQYEPTILKNIQLKAQHEELSRQVLEKTSRSANLALKGSQVGAKSRARSVLDLSRGKDLNKSSHSQRSKNIMAAVDQKNYEDNLIDEIIQQKKTNSSINEIIRQENNKRIQMATEDELKLIKQKINALFQLLNRKQSKQNERMSKSAHSNLSKGSRIRQSRAIKSKYNPDDAMPVTSAKQPSRISINQLKKYIQQQQQQKRYLYDELIVFKQEMQIMAQENQNMKTQLAIQSMDKSKNKKILE